VILGYHDVYLMKLALYYGILCSVDVAIQYKHFGVLVLYLYIILLRNSVIRFIKFSIAMECQLRNMNLQIEYMYLILFCTRYLYGTILSQYTNKVGIYQVKLNIQYIIINLPSIIIPIYIMLT